MSKVKKLNIALVFVVCLLFALFCGSTSADESGTNSGYQEVPVYVDGLLACRGYNSGDTTYISFEAICGVLGYDAQFNFDEDTDTLTVEVGGVQVTVGSNDRYLCANGRCFYLPDRYLEIDGAAVLPIEAIAKIFTLDVSYNEESGNYNIDTSSMAMLESGDSYYNEEDLYWLSRIITAESGDQPLDGQIAVGNVVLNRVESTSFPNTIHDVIFDTNCGVQFTPIVNGSIYSNPFTISTIAAKLCLEGYSVVDDALYFQCTYVSGWINSSKTYVTTIGAHAFYS